MGTKQSKINEKGDLFYPERGEKIFNVVSSVSHYVFLNTPDNQKITPSTEHGVRVLVAKYPDFHKIYFCKYIYQHTDNFPFGGIKVWNSEVDQMQYFYYDSVALHPSGGSHRIYDKE
jgi:hypothetical protein